MALITRTYTFTDGTVAYGSQVNSEINNIVNTINSLDQGNTTWSNVKATTFTFTGVPDLQNFRIKNVGTPTTSGDAAQYPITTTQIASSTIVGGNIAASTITGSNIASGTVTGNNIATGTISSANIADGTISGTDIASSTITTSNILAGAISQYVLGGVGSIAAVQTTTDETINITCTGGTILIFASISIQATTGGAATTLTMGVTRGTSTALLGNAAKVTFEASSTLIRSVSVMTADVPGAGAVSYVMSHGWTSGPTESVLNRSFVVVELKK